MKYFRIDGELTDEVTDKLVEFFNTYTEDKKIVYLSSPGGSVYHAEVITDILNLNKLKTTLVLGEYLYSSAVCVAFDFQGNKRFLPQGTLSMLHFTNVDVSARDLHDENSLASVQVKEVAMLNAKLLEKYFKFLTHTELELVQKGKEVWLESERTKKLILNELPEMSSM